MKTSLYILVALLCGYTAVGNTPRKDSSTAPDAPLSISTADDVLKLQNDPKALQSFMQKLEAADKKTNVINDQFFGGAPILIGNETDGYSLNRDFFSGKTDPPINKEQAQQIFNMFFEVYEGKHELRIDVQRFFKDTLKLRSGEGNMYPQSQGGGRSATICIACEMHEYVNALRSIAKGEPPKTLARNEHQGTCTNCKGGPGCTNCGDAPPGTCKNCGPAQEAENERRVFPPGGPGGPGINGGPGTNGGAAQEMASNGEGGGGGGGRGPSGGSHSGGTGGNQNALASNPASNNSNNPNGNPSNNKSSSSKDKALSFNETMDLLGPKNRDPKEAPKKEKEEKAPVFVARALNTQNLIALDVIKGAKGKSKFRNRLLPQRKRPAKLPEFDTQIAFVGLNTESPAPETGKAFMKKKKTNTLGYSVRNSPLTKGIYQNTTSENQTSLSLTETDGAHKKSGND